MQKLFLVETLHQFKLTITTDHKITSTGGNCMCRICTINAESRNHSKFQMHVQCNSVPPSPPPTPPKKNENENEQLCTIGSALGDAWLKRTQCISEQSISFEDTITAMLNRLLTTLKKFGINLPIRPSVRPSITLLHLSVYDYPRNKMYAVLSRVRAKRTPNQFC